MVSQKDHIQVTYVICRNLWGGKTNLHWCQIQEHKLCVSCRLTKLYNTPYNKTDLHTIHDFCGLVYWVL